jgi:hypothetical protein
MRVCLTVHGEQPISSATSVMFRGGPSGEAMASGNAPGWPGIRARWGGQWGGQCCPPVKGEKACKCAGLRARGTQGFGAEAEPRFVREFRSLMSMVVSAGSMK